MMTEENRVEEEVGTAPVAIDSPYAMFGTSKKHENEGVAIDYGTFAVVVKRAGPSNIPFQKKFRKLLNKKGRAIELGGIEDKDVEAELVHIFAETVIVDWRQVKDREGNVIPFSIQNCKKVMSDLPDLFRDLQLKAMNFETFRDEEATETGKN